jgi:hypothetical protein
MHLFVEVCPSGRRWFDVAQSTVSGHRNAECSGIGDCNRISVLKVMKVKHVILESV